MMLGTVKWWETGKGVSVIIDGEESRTSKEYLWLASYRPMTNDRVLIEEVGGQYVILGKVTNDIAASSLANNVTNRIVSGDEGYVCLGIKGGDLYFGLVPYDGSASTMYKLAKG